MNKHVSQGIFESVRTWEPPGYAAHKVRGWRVMPLYLPLPLAYCFLLPPFMALHLFLFIIFLFPLLSFYIKAVDARALAAVSCSVTSV